MKKSNIKVVPFNKSTYDKRYCIIDTDTGEVIDDCQGYGYKSFQKAMACWGWKNRDKSKDEEKKTKLQIIWQWLDNHKGFGRLLAQYASEIETEVNADLVKKILADSNLSIKGTGFSAGQLLRAWQRYGEQV